MASTDRSYFDEMYASDADPWDFETSWYERRKYALTLAALPKPRYVSAFEPGCSIGVFTSLLAPRCDQLLSTDIVPTALNRATDRLNGRANVHLDLRAIPEDWPNGIFDLVVLSEIAYYFDAQTLAEILSLVTMSTSLGGTVVGVHWRGSTNYPLSGDAAHDILNGSAQLNRFVHHIEPDFVLDLWERIQ
jgi:hypothetical protein